MSLAELRLAGRCVGMANLREQGYELRGLREDVHILLLDGFGDGCFGLVV